MLLSPEVLTLQILNIIFVLFAFVALYLSINIYLKWDFNATTSLQYNLEKQSTLTATIIKSILVIKVPLFLFFIFTLDKLSSSLTGAMCASGIVDATSYGLYLFALKIINIYLFGFWLIAHNLDIKKENLPYTKIKFAFFILIFVFFISEVILETLMFNAIDINKIVSCCGTIYSTTNQSLISNILTINKTLLLTLFYGLFFLLFISYKLKQSYIFIIVNFFFLVVSILSLILFFSSYIYQLPTHHCPFCFLQKDYYYIGYVLYSLLFLGTFFGFVAGFLHKYKYYYIISLTFNLVYIIIISLYPIVFYIKNGVWL
jgi:hypothetical protein